MSWKLEQTYQTLPGHFFQRVLPTPVAQPQFALCNDTLARELGFDPAKIFTPENAEIFSGNRLPPESVSIAQAYAGHQFAHFTMLGDGRAILLGEQITPQNERFDIQLKGSGPTPYSRRGDGRAALGPMLREYIISEAMHALGIPTTRSLAVITTGETVERETELPGAILTRIARSHIRVGTFQFASGVNQNDGLKKLADYTIERHFSEIANHDQPYRALLKEVINQQAKLISQWMLVGFIHGVMNTDNMSIAGETIDYGPCAFMDTFHSGTVYSSIDRHGRYAYGNQPNIAQWNLARFAESLLPILHENREKAVKIAEDELQSFPSIFQDYWLAGMRKKLGLTNTEESDLSLAKQLLQLMEHHELDFTNTFLNLTKKVEIPVLNQWQFDWKARLERQENSNEESHQLMQRSNPSVIPRNHRVEEALKAATIDRDFSKVKKLVSILQKNFIDSDDHPHFQNPPEPGEIVHQTFCGT